MKKIGMIVAVEIKAVLDKYGSQLKAEEKQDIRFWNIRQKIIIW